MADMDEDEDYGFFAATAGRSTLSNLFAGTVTGNEDNVNQALTYVPPKQPKKIDDKAKDNTSAKGLKLIHAEAGYTYKLVGGQYTNQGKIGAAILGDPVVATYVLLLYKGKQQRVTECNINANFNFTIEPNNYAKFADQNNEQWSLKFSSEDILINFAKKIAIVKATSSGNPLAKLIIQDLVAGEGNTVAVGDSVDVSYTAWLFRNQGFGEVFDESSRSDKPFVVRLGKTNVIKGLSEGLVGCQKGLKRLLVIPPSLAFRSDEHTHSGPVNQPVIFEITVNRVKSSREKSHSPSHSRTSSEVRPEVPLRSQSISDDTIRSRGASISEQLTQSPRKDNAKLISRMAKMGLPMLPMQGAVVTNVHTSSESEPEKEIEHEPSPRLQNTMPRNAQPVVPVISQIEAQIDEVFTNPRSAPSPRTSSPHVQAGVLPYSPYVMPGVPGDSFPYFHPTSVQAHPTPSYITPMGLMDSHLPLLVAETRTHNTEVRLMLGKVNDKLDLMIPKIDDLRVQQNSTPLQSQATYMESTILSQNIERIIQENAQLKKENESKTSKIQELNEKICDILQRNQGFFEESNNILDKQTDSLQMTTSQLQNKILMLENEKLKLNTELNEISASQCKTQSQFQESQNLILQLQQKLEVSQQEVNESKKIIESIKTHKNDTETFQSNLNDNLASLKEELSSVQMQLEETKKKRDSAIEERDSVENKMATLAATVEAGASELELLKKEIEEKADIVSQWKSKYETLRENTRLLKQRYEMEIKNLSTQLVEAKVSNSTQNSLQDFSAEIRKTMNSLYKQLQGKLNESQMYNKKEILEISLDIIRNVTLRYITLGDQNTRSSSRKNSGEQSSQKSNFSQPDVAVPENQRTAEKPVEMLQSNDKDEESRTLVKPDEEATIDSLVSDVNEVQINDALNPVVDVQSSSDTAQECDGDRTSDEVSLPDGNTEEKTSTEPPLLIVEEKEESRKSPDIWRPQPPTPPLFDDDTEEDEDDWLK